MAPTTEIIRTYVFNMRLGYTLIVYIKENWIKIYLGREYNGVEILFLDYEIYGTGLSSCSEGSLPDLVSID